MTNIIAINDSHAARWDAYVYNHPHATVYHRFAFKRTVEDAYGHASAYLAAFDGTADRVVGVLPLFNVSSMLFGKTLVSLPFCDYAGVLYDDEQIGSLLIEKALSLLRKTRCDVVEMRQTFPLPFFSSFDPKRRRAVDSKVRMKLALPPNSSGLFSSFSAKLRSQIRKPQKEGCRIRDGGKELLDDFYRVFVYNMRDLGSPVHSKKMMAAMLHHYNAAARLFVVYKETVPVACSFVAGFNKVLFNPWASFNKNYRACAPNMLLYWGMLEYAIANGYSFFDFGRSTKDEGTYRFKEQWGAVPQPLCWYYLHRRKKPAVHNDDENNKKRFIAVWRNLPLWVSRVLGPIIRKRIPL